MVHARVRTGRWRTRYSVRQGSKAQPIRRVFSPFFKRTRQHPSPFDSQPRYRSIVEDPLWYWLYLPVAWIVERLTRVVDFLQRGRIAIYLMYSFITLITLLVLTRG